MDKLVRDGAELAYAVAGEGDRTMVLIHGMVCDHRYFATQAEHFSKDYRVISLDLRGHGESDARPGSCHPDAYADDVVWLLRELGVEKPIVVGHSMGGLVALRLAHLFPEVPAAIVALDSAWLMPEAFAAAGPAVLQALQAPDGKEAFRGVLESAFFLPTDDRQRAEWIVDDMCSADLEIIAGEWEQAVIRTDTETPLANLQVPALYIGAAHPFGDLARIREVPGVTVGQCVGSGHFIQMECPDQVNSMIERYLATAVPPTNAELVAQA